MNMLYTLNSERCDTRSGSVFFHSQVKSIKRYINLFVYQGAKHWNATPANDTEFFNILEIM